MLRIGIVGAGLRGQLFARALMNMADVEVVGLCDPAPTVRVEAAATLGVPVHESDDELFAHALDAAVIATPDFAHAAPAVAAAEAGLDLLVEKPLATTAEDAIAIERAVRRAGVQGYVAFENRWSPTFRQVRELARTGALGEIRVQSARLNNARSVPREMISWADRSTPAWFLMPHSLDMALWLSGHEVRTVRASGVRGVLDGMGVHTWDGVIAHLTLTDGSVVVLESVWSLPDSMPSVVDYKFEVIGTRSAAYVDHQDQMLRLAGPSFELPRTQSFVAAGQLHGSPAWMARSFALRLLGHDEELPTIEEGVYVTQVIAAVHDALESGSTVLLGEAAPDGRAQVAG